MALTCNQQNEVLPCSAVSSNSSVLFWWLAYIEGWAVKVASHYFPFIFLHPVAGALLIDTLGIF